MKISVLGSGGWGTALALVLLENGHEVTLWSYSAKESCQLDETHENPFLKGVTLPEIKKLKAMAVRGAEAEQKVKKQQQTIDRLEAENASLQRQLPAEPLDRAKVFHLRGGIDYQKLSFGHRTMMKLLYQSLRRVPLEKQTAENRALIETYGKQVDFTDFSALEPIILEIQRIR